MNWGSSYIVNDFYARFIDENASEKKQVFVGKLSTVILMIISAVFALYLTNAMQAFNILLQIGAGTGLLFLLRWFWWRINAYSEITAMIVSFIIAIYFELIYSGTLEPYQKMVIGVCITSVSWISVTFLTRPTDPERLYAFYTMIKPHAFGWKKILKNRVADETQNAEASASSFSRELLLMFLACIMVYCSLFSVGYWLYFEYSFALVTMLIAVLCAILIFRLWK